MPSPFPGMNPYLEQRSVWQDFHNSLIPAIRGFLTPQIDPYFVVWIEENLYIREPSAEERIRIGRADVALDRAISAAKTETGRQATLEAPRQVVVSTEFDVEKQLYLKIENRESREVVAVIEVLSPSNKEPGVDREHYSLKRRGILHSHANFIEIDLLRGWNKMSADLPICDYGVLVSRYEDRPKAGYWPLSLRDRLPIIPIQLRDPALEATLDLQDVLDKVYDEANYKRTIYSGRPTPPLKGEDLEWAQAILKSAGIINS